MGIELARSQEGGVEKTGDPIKRWSIDPNVEAQDRIVSRVVKRLHRTAYVPENQAHPLEIGHWKPATPLEIDLHHKEYPLTMLIYLSDDINGGETVFTKPVGCGSIAKCCSRGAKNGDLIIPAKRGRAVLFWSHSMKDGSVDPSSTHGACPVKSGEKWIAQRFFSKKPLLKVSHELDPEFDVSPNGGKAVA